LVLVLAKAIALAGHRVAVGWWPAVAYFWHDAAVILAAAAVELVFARRPRMAWTAYAAIVFYVAINIPVIRAVSTPLTWAMWRAARGPLADSMRYYVTWGNALLFLAVIAAAALAPVVLRHVRIWPVVAGCAIVAALGPFAGHRVATAGLERNAWSALLTTALRRTAWPQPAGAWRAAGFDSTPQPDLTRFRGIAAGRNIILVSLESTAAQYLGIYGAMPDPMPRLSALARSAIVFDNAYAVYPESIKGLFSILCSTYPAFDSGENYAAAPCDALPEILRRREYRTALFHSGRFGYLGMESVVRGRGFDTLADAGDIGGNHNSSFGVDEPSAVARLLQWIDALPAGRRFFVTYLPIAGHHPYETPEAGPFPDGDPFGRYRNALRYGDSALGVLIDGIRARGLGESTLWIVLGDHGEAFGQHDGNYGHTFQLYEENIHVPLLIAAPGAIEGQVRSGRVVSLIDTAPGVLDLIGAEGPPGYQGRSLLDPAPRLAFFFADYSLGLLGLRDGPRKVIYELASNRARLFDLSRDPGESSDLAAREAERARWYAENLRAWSAAQRVLLRAAK
jgi:arylsulfatase A-like enzyme